MNNKRLGRFLFLLILLQGFCMIANAQKPNVPILCFHNIRDWKATDTKSERTYIMPVGTFKNLMKLLHDSGYHAILPDQLMGYLQKGEKLPSKPVMLTFDDADASQYQNALPELDKYGYKSVFFIMTVVLGRPNYMSRDQVRDLFTRGHVIGCHTWDHHMVTKYTDKDWTIQIEKPLAELEKITGKPIKYFAYPFGLWNPAAIQHIKKYGFTAAFRLAGKPDPNEPLYTIKRIIADGAGTAPQILSTMKRSF
jgi:peptidoglycan/xylan/chitin deacetylase (PgdA/CDA1 family)